MKNFCLDLQDHAIKIMNNEEKKEMIPLNKEEKNTIQAKKHHICKKRFSSDNDNKTHHKVRDHFNYTGKYRGASHNIFNLTYKTLKVISIFFHKGSTYNCYFRIKKLVK